MYVILRDKSYLLNPRPWWISIPGLTPLSGSEMTVCHINKSCLLVNRLLIVSKKHLALVTENNFFIIMHGHRVGWGGAFRNWESTALSHGKLIAWKGDPLMQCIGNIFCFQLLLFDRAIILPSRNWRTMALLGKQNQKNFLDSIGNQPILKWKHPRVIPPPNRTGPKTPEYNLTRTYYLAPCDLDLDLQLWPWPMTLVTLTLEHIFLYKAENWIFYIFDLGHPDLWPMILTFKLVRDMMALNAYAKV